MSPGDDQAREAQDNAPIARTAAAATAPERTGNVTLEDVEDAMTHLARVGARVTIREIRRYLQRGSFTTIANFRRAIHARDAATEPGAPGAIALPDPILRGLIQGAQAHWNELNAAADTRVNEERGRCESAVAHAEANTGAAERARAEAERIAEEAGDAAARSDARASESAAAHERATAVIATLEDRIAEAAQRIEAHEATLAALGESVKSHRAHRESAEAALADERTGHADTAKALKATEKTLAREHQQRERAEIESRELRATLARESDDRAREAAQSARALAAADARLEAAQHGAERCAAELKDARNAETTSATALARESALRESEAGERASLAQRLETLQAQHRALEEALRAAEARSVTDEAQDSAPNP